MTKIQIEPEEFAAARRASNLSLEDAAKLCGIAARQTYASRESRPGDFKLSELTSLYHNLNGPGKKILREAVTSLFLP